MILSDRAEFELARKFAPKGARPIVYSQPGGAPPDALQDGIVRLQNHRDLTISRGVHGNAPPVGLVMTNRRWIELFFCPLRGFGGDLVAIAQLKRWVTPLN
jgi:hypothetical protein